MGIFNFLTFKKEISKIFTKENVISILDLAKNEIIRQKDYIYKKGAEKKSAVDSIVISKIETLKINCKNKWVLWILDRVIDLIPTITQMIYDCLKEKVKNL